MTSMRSFADRTFAAMGTQVRIVVHGDDAATLAARAEREIHDFDRRLSRFAPDSELTRLNDDPRDVVPASALLCEAVGIALEAAHRSGGLVDPCLLDALEAAGYRRSFTPGEPLPPQPGGSRSPARPASAARWRSIAVTGTVVMRPPGLRLDLGGTGKGHAADRVAELLAPAPGFFVDCGGDIRVGGAEQEVLVAHPLTGEPAASFTLSDAAIAASSIVARAWTGEDGERMHHLLDPATGRPAATGLVAATAIAPTTIEAETLAKVALLRGPGGAPRDELAEHGAILWHDDGRMERLG